MYHRAARRRRGVLPQQPKAEFTQQIPIAPYRDEWAGRVEASAQNVIVPEGDTPQLFHAYVDVVDVATSGVLDAKEVVIIVPAAPGGAGT